MIQKLTNKLINIYKYQSYLQYLQYNLQLKVKKKITALIRMKSITRKTGDVQWLNRVLDISLNVAGSNFDKRCN